MTFHSTDLLVVGSGPGGLSAAINAASEGISTSIIEADEILGGQAKKSFEIANYPGFPCGVTGECLTSRMVSQAVKFGVKIIAPHRAEELRLEASDKIVSCADFEEIRAKSVLLATGLTYRRHEAEGLGELLGRGVFYGNLPYRLNGGKHRVAIVGGANSAGQAVLRYANHPKTEVILVSRSSLAKEMSQYLIDEVKGLSNVKVLEGKNVAVCHAANEKLAAISVTDGVTSEEIPVEALMVYIGGVPQTRWLSKSLDLTEKNFIRTGGPLRDAFETSIPGVFAVGDIRDGSMKRIAAAAGEGSAVVPHIHQYLGQRS